MQPKDIPFAVRLTDQEEWGVTPSALKRLMRLNPRGCFIAYDGTTRLGSRPLPLRQRTCLDWQCDRGQEPSRETHRTKLVEHAVSFLHKSRVKHIALYCFSEHEKFYENLGFVKDASSFGLNVVQRRRSQPRSRPIPPAATADQGLGGG